MNPQERMYAFSFKRKSDAAVNPRDFKAFHPQLHKKQAQPKKKKKCRFQNKNCKQANLLSSLFSKEGHTEIPSLGQKQFFLFLCLKPGRNEKTASVAAVVSLSHSLLLSLGRLCCFDFFPSSLLLYSRLLVG